MNHAWCNLRPVPACLGLSQLSLKNIATGKTSQIITSIILLTISSFAFGLANEVNHVVVWCPPDADVPHLSLNWRGGLITFYRFSFGPNISTIMLDRFLALWEHVGRIIVHVEMLNYIACGYRILGACIHWFKSQFSSCDTVFTDKRLFSHSVLVSSRYF